jgi:hypothetical protein
MMDSIEAALRDVIRAWEALSPGDCTPVDVQLWLNDEMTPAIHRARDALNLSNVPPGDVSDNVGA